MNGAQTQALATPIAEALGPDWTVAEDRYHNAGRWELHGPGGIELCVLLGPAHVAVRGIHDGVGGILPHAYGCKQPTIRFSATKTPRRMAGVM